MYSQRIILENVDQFEAQEGWRPVYHTLDEVRGFTAYIESLTKMESNSRSSYISLLRPITEKRKQEIKRWIQNEQVLCSLDCNYWETRYAWVCCPAEAPIWMADYTFKPIGEIRIGDEIIGFEKRPIKNKPKATLTSRGRRWTTELDNLTKTKVTAIHRKISPVIKVTMESGKIIRCTPDHLWSSGENDRSLYPWIAARVGKRLRRVVDVYPNDPPDVRLAAWLGGMYDGEGSGAEIAQYRGHNPEVHQKLVDAMKMFGFEQKFRSGKCEKGSEYKGFSDTCVRINGEITGKAKFAAWCKPVRMGSLEKHILQTLRAYRDRIVDIQPDGEEEVFALTTGTGNYVAWGYASKNCDEKGNIYKFQPRLSQKLLDAVIAEFDEKQVSIELLVLKGRQLGVTTWAALKFLRRMLFVPHTQAIMASVQADKSELIGRILDTAYNRCPWWLVPRRLPKRAFENGSVLSIQSGMQATGLAQGWTPSCVHVSELADIPNPQKTIEEGLLRATHSSRNLFMVLEGTGGGNIGWLADSWKSAKEDWPKGQSRLCPIFVPWPMAPDIYPEPDWIRKFPPDGAFDPRDEATRKHVARCESYIRNTPYLAKVAGRNWKMPIEQQWFWQFNYKQACKNHTQKIWLAQMPADDYEALTGVHDTVFEPEVIDEVENRVYEIMTKSSGDAKVRRVPLEAYAITGHSIDATFEPDDAIIDGDKEIIPITWKSYRGDRYEWELVPLLPLNEATERDTFDKLLVYEPPRSGFDYACGVDTADGLDKEDEERACASISKVGTGIDYDEQACEITSRRMNPAQMVPFVACMAAWYGQKAKDWRGVKFAIEQIRGPGDTCQNQLKIMGFNYHHVPRRYDSKKVKDDSKHKQGWYSTTWSVPILMTRFVEAVNGGWYIPKSRWLIEELKTLERHITGSKSKMEHRSGQFDDRVRAAAQSYFTTHDLDDLAERAQKRYAIPQRKKRDQEPAMCASNVFSVGDWND